MNLPFHLPPLAKDGPIPFWNGSNFCLGEDVIRVLQYSVNNLGWNDDLTFFHEESAGDHHFIDRASRDHAISELKKNIKNPNPVILEVGCSSGFMLQRIQKAFPNGIVIGSDIVVEPLKKLAETLPQIPLFRFDLTHCPLPDNCLDAVVILNVLEHIEHDSIALQQIKRVLKPGGIVVIEVPAGPNLYDIYDKVLMHYRRYSFSDLAKIIKQQGFKIINRSHLGFFLYPGFWIVKQKNKRLLSESETIQQEMVDKTIRATGENKILHMLMQTELFLGRFISYPFGIRCLATCKK